MKEDVFALLDADGFPMAEAFAVDGELLITDFPAVGFIVFFVAGRRRERQVVGIGHFFGCEERFPLVSGEENFPIVAASVEVGIDVDEAVLASISAAT